ncbi:MAG TPA: hypothetical protein VG295_00080 [Solirubrobacteraceae bacterium]|nr:hypothetical protein [Solirubrobacteraceae bacterium]
MPAYRVRGALTAALIALASAGAAAAPAGALAHARPHHHAHHVAIPQHNRGDRDPDNNGHPSDRDGGI